LEVFDFDLDTEVAKKAMLKTQHSVDVDSVVLSNGDTIRFIVNESSEEGNKKYILRWTPFTKDENNKDTKKKEIKGLQSSSIVRLYPFDRILGLTLCQSVFSLFSKDDEKTGLVLYDFSAKKVGEYDLPSDLLNVELSERGVLYGIGPNRVSVYSVASEQRGRLEKMGELDLAALSLVPIGSHLLVRKDTNYLLLDSNFECVQRV
jgi:hypothetical protein